MCVCQVTDENGEKQLLQISGDGDTQYLQVLMAQPADAGDDDAGDDPGDSGPLATTDTTTVVTAVDVMQPAETQVTPRLPPTRRRS